MSSYFQLVLSVEVNSPHQEHLGSGNHLAIPRLRVALFGERFNELMGVEASSEGNFLGSMVKNEMKKTNELIMLDLLLRRIDRSTLSM